VTPHAENSRHSLPFSSHLLRDNYCLFSEHRSTPLLLLIHDEVPLPTPLPLLALVFPLAGKYIFFLRCILDFASSSRRPLFSLITIPAPRFTVKRLRSFSSRQWVAQLLARPGFAVYSLLLSILRSSPSPASSRFFSPLFLEVTKSAADSLSLFFRDETIRRGLPFPGSPKPILRIPAGRGRTAVSFHCTGKSRPRPRAANTAALFSLFFPPSFTCESSAGIRSFFPLSSRRRNSPLSGRKYTLLPLPSAISTGSRRLVASFFSSSGTFLELAVKKTPPPQNKKKKKKHFFFPPCSCHGYPSLQVGQCAGLVSIFPCFPSPLSS